MGGRFVIKPSLVYRGHRALHPLVLGRISFRYPVLQPFYATKSTTPFTFVLHMYLFKFLFETFVLCLQLFIGPQHAGVLLLCVAPGHLFGVAVFGFFRLRRQVSFVCTRRLIMAYNSFLRAWH